VDNDEPKIIEVDSDEEAPELHEGTAHDETAPESELVSNIPGKYKQSRSEKKARKAVTKLGLNSVPGVQRVTIKKAKEVQISIQHPDVWSTSNGKCYIIFGETKMGNDDLGANWDDIAAGLEDNADDDDGPPELLDADSPPDLVEATSDIIGNEDSVTSKYLDLVLGQVPSNVTREEAIEALKATNNDIVAAVFQLKMLHQ